MVAVVVPSPATSLGFWAAAVTSLAPMFSKGSGRSVSLLTVTPSLVTVGPPKDLSRITLRPVGPRVMPTARASLSAPASSFLRASSVYNNCFAIFHKSPMCGYSFVFRCQRQRLLDDLCKDIALPHTLDLPPSHFHV